MHLSYNIYSRIKPSNKNKASIPCPCSVSSLQNFSNIQMLKLKIIDVVIVVEIVRYQIRLGGTLDTKYNYLVLVYLVTDYQYLPTHATS